MICSVEQPDGSYRQEERQPICNVDFCDSCGDCLVCYGEDECLSNSDRKHMWVKYRL